MNLKKYEQGFVSYGIKLPNSWLKSPVIKQLLKYKKQREKLDREIMQLDLFGVANVPKDKKSKDSLRSTYNGNICSR
jgi:hypothetical protein